jgi:hypothetical protein
VSAATYSTDNEVHALSVLMRPPLRDDHANRSDSLSLSTGASLPDSVTDSPLTRIHDIVTRLLELGPTLFDIRTRNPAIFCHDAALYDIGHVRTRFPMASTSLVERLGRANWERRQYLLDVQTKMGARSPKSHNVCTIEPVLRDIRIDISDSESEGDKGEDDHNFNLDSNEQSSKLSVTGSTHGSSSSASDVPSPSRLSSYGTEQTVIAGPVKDGNTHYRDTHYRLPLPPPPNEKLTGETFICPFCAQTISGLSKSSDWREHVLDDLKPYVCTQADCTSPTTIYGSRKSWWEHEAERHHVNRSWICKPCEQERSVSTFETSTSFVDHFAHHHAAKITHMQLLNIRDMCQRDAGRRAPSRICPLCQTTILSASSTSIRRLDLAVKRHVSYHMEQLAFSVASLASQMPFADYASEFQDDSDYEDGLQSEIRTIASRETHLSKSEIHVANLKAFIADQERVAVAGDSSNSHLPKASSTETTFADSLDPIATQNPDTGIPNFPIFVQVPPPNEHFYSRTVLLQDLDNCLSSSGTTCIVHGAGGVGKTLAAVQYSHVHKEQYDAVFWLHADTAPGLTDSYLKMALALGVADSPEDHHLIMAKGRNWLQETGISLIYVFAPCLRFTDNNRKTLATCFRQRGTVG